MFLPRPLSWYTSLADAFIECLFNSWAPSKQAPHVKEELNSSVNLLLTPLYLHNCSKSFSSAYLQRKSSCRPVRTQRNKCGVRLVALLRLALIWLRLGAVCHYKGGGKKIKWVSVMRRTNAAATVAPPACAASLRPSHVTSRQLENQSLVRNFKDFKLI